MLVTRLHYVLPSADNVFHAEQPFFTGDIVGTAHSSTLFHVDCHDNIIEHLTVVILANGQALMVLS